MTSPDGITWTERVSAADNEWVSVCWSPDEAIFVAVARSGTGNRVMTSVNGINWTIRVSAADNHWKSVCWSPGLNLFAAVARSGIDNRVMTSPDGITWAIRVTPADNQWMSVCWAPALNLFVAVAATGNGDRVMTSANGILWTIRTAAASNEWMSVCWSPDEALLVAVAKSGTDNRVMTSANGINWTIRVTPYDNYWYAVCWSPAENVFCAVAYTDQAALPAPPHEGGGDEDADDGDHKEDVTDITPYKGHVMYLLFAGGATPAGGWEDASAANKYFNNHFPVGGKLGIDCDTDESVAVATLVTCGPIDVTTPCIDTGPHPLTDAHIHGQGDIHSELADAKPPYKSLKMIRYPGVKAMIPEDAIIIFDDAVPTGFTRYAAQDGKYVRCEAAVGNVGGNATRVFRVHGDTAVGGNVDDVSEWDTDSKCTVGDHTHPFDANSPAINNLPPTINVVLGQADNDLDYIPEGAILMFDENPPVADWEVLSGIGDDFEGKVLKGAAAYGDGGGTETLTPANLVADTGAGTLPGPLYVQMPNWTTCMHVHELEFSFEAVTTYPACRPVVFAKAKHNITTDGPAANIIRTDAYGYSGGYAMDNIYSISSKHLIIDFDGVLHAAFCTSDDWAIEHAWHACSDDSGKTWTLERIDDAYAGEQHTASVVVDAANNLHFAWAEYDTADANHRQIKYRRKSAAGVFGAVETVSTAGNPWYQYDPCINVKRDGGTVGVVWAGQGWGTDNPQFDIAYRERTPIGWGAEVHITAIAAPTFDFRRPSVDFDADNYPHTAYQYGKVDRTWGQVFYSYEDAGGWNDEWVNSDVADQTECTRPSNIVIDLDGNIHIAYVHSVPDISTSLDGYYKYRTPNPGGVWQARETIRVNGADRFQIQVDRTGAVMAVYSFHADLGAGNLRYIALYCTRPSGGAWGGHTFIKIDQNRDYGLCQMMWSRLPFTGGAFQSLSQQHYIFIFVSSPFSDSGTGNIEFYPQPQTVVGAIKEVIPIETYRTKQRGVLCRNKLGLSNLVATEIG